MVQSVERQPQAFGRDASPKPAFLRPEATRRGAKAASSMPVPLVSLDAESHWGSVGAIRIFVALNIQKLLSLQCPPR